MTQNPYFPLKLDFFVGFSCLKPEVAIFSRKGPQISNWKFTFLELCRCKEANFWHVNSFWGYTKNLCWNFQNFDFLGPKLHYAWFKIAIFVFIEISYRIHILGKKNLPKDPFWVKKWVLGHFLFTFYIWKI